MLGPTVQSYYLKQFKDFKYKYYFILLPPNNMNSDITHAGSWLIQVVTPLSFPLTPQ